MTDRDVLAPGDARWAEFLDALAAADRCRRTTEHARRTLERIPGVDVDATLAALAARGGLCDCSILFGLDEAPVAGGARGAFAENPAIGWGTPA